MSAPPLLDVERAQAMILQSTGPLPAESIPTADASERVLASDVLARWDLPQCNVSIMDGYAIRSGDVQAALEGGASAVVLRRVTHSAAGHPTSHRIEPGQAARISTGAVIPAGADAVVPQEDTGIDGDRITVHLDRSGAIPPGTWIRPAGSDLRAEAVAVAAGTRLGPGDVALAGSAGHAELRVHARPRVAILSTGDELVPLGQQPSTGQLVSTNGIMLAACARAAGGQVQDLGNVGDDPDALRGALQRGLQAADVLVTSGGISVGDHDLVHGALLELGCRWVFRGVAFRPGKPAAFGVADQTLVFALPGNPASALVAFELLVRPALRRALGVRGDPRPPTIRVRLAAPVRGAGTRIHYVRARLGKSGVATPLADQLSGNLRSIHDFDVLVVVPAGTSTLDAGNEAEALVVDAQWNDKRP